MKSGKSIESDNGDGKDVNKRDAKPVVPLSSAEKRANPFIVAPLREGSTPQGFFHDWINSDEYRKRIESNQYDNPDETINNRLRNLERSSIEFSDAKSVAAPSGNVNINSQDASKYGANVVVPHELGHLIGGSYPGQYDSSMSTFEKSLLDTGNINRSSNSHDAIAPEMKSDLDSNRFNLFKKGIYDIKKGEPFTKEHLKKAKESFKNDETFNRLINQTGDDNYIRLMNTVARSESPKIFSRSVAEIINSKS